MNWIYVIQDKYTETYAAYLKTTTRKDPKTSLSKFFESSPLRDIEIDLVRVKELGREEVKL